MRSESKGELVRRVALRTVRLFLLGLFLPWVGKPQVVQQQGTVYAQIAQLIGAGASQESVAKLSPQQ